MRYLPNLRLRAEREQRKWPRSYMAEKLNLGDPKTIARWERGAALPSPHFRRKLCELFGLSAEELGLVSPGVATPEIPPSHPALPMSQPQTIQKGSSEREGKDWYVHYRRNPFFTGREDVLTSLHTVFSSERLTALSYIQALSGLGGIGKTHIAIEYAYRFRDHYSGVFWVQADTRDDLISSCIGLLDFLGHPLREQKKDEDPLAVFNSWLSRHTSWLLIMDNIEDLTLIQQILPTDCRGHVLLTTRVQSTGSFARCIPLDQMTDPEGALFLLRRIKRLEPDAMLVQSPPTDQLSGKELSSLLGGLPLALDQAGAYIEETGCSISDYLQRYTHQRTQLLDRRGISVGEHPHSVTATFSLVYEQVKQKNPLASDLLCLCAFLSADGIPEELFVAETSHADSPVFADFYQLDQAIALLRSFSLVQRHPETQTFSLHRLVQAVLQEEMSESERAAFQQQAIHRLHALFPEDTHVARKQYERFMPHLLALVAALPDEAGDAVLSNLLRKAADYLCEHAQYKQAERFCQWSIRILERLEEPEHAELAMSLSGLATVYFARAQYTQAEALYQRTLRIREQTLGPEHPTTARTLNNLALISMRQGKDEQAEALYQRALRIREQTLGPNNEKLAHPLNNLANLYRRQGKYEQADLLYRRALHIWEQTLGPEHYLVARPLHNLAELSAELERYEQAEALYKRAESIMEQALGPEHPDVARPVCGLAFISMKQGRNEQAEALYRRALRVWEQALGPEHYLVATAYEGLATLYGGQGRGAEAEVLYKRALTIWEQHQGQSPREMMQTLNGLANLYVQQHKYEQAEALYERALRLQEQPGQSHPERAKSMLGLAELYKKQGKDKQAELLLQRTPFEQSRR